MSRKIIGVTVSTPRNPNKIADNSDNGIDLTQAEYDALSDEEKMKGTYYITDGVGGSGGTTCTATYGYFGKSLALTWDEIKSKTAVGDFSEINIGDYKDIVLSNGEVVRMEVAGIDTYIGYPSNNNHRIYWISRDCLETTYPMNDSDKNAGGFPASKLLTTLNTTIFAMLPTEVQNVIVVDKRLVSTKGSWTWLESLKLWLPSEVEVWGHNTWSEVDYGNGCGIQFPLFVGSLRHICKGLGFGASAMGLRCHWWCDSPLASVATHFCIVDVDGFARSNYASKATGVPVCFTT